MSSREEFRNKMKLRGKNAQKNIQSAILSALDKEKKSINNKKKKNNIHIR